MNSLTEDSYKAMSLAPTVNLNSRQDYPYWISGVKWSACQLGVWNQINPARYDPVARAAQAAIEEANGGDNDGIPSLESIREEEIARRVAKGTASTATSQSSERDEQVAEPSPEELRQLLDIAQRNAIIIQSKKSANVSAMIQISRYIQKTVKPEFLLPIMLDCTSNNLNTVADILYKIKQQFEPTNLSTVTRLREEYRRYL
ncbi:hypothetical protein F4774DRAFT_404657 [Daldinia eschscholtzii]|nr:hypothetical protein F4774DRAFT_404657 [Daldinia eschscholtzii]